MNPSEIYRNRPLSEGIPGMETQYVQMKRVRLEQRLPSDLKRGGLGDILECIARLIDLDAGPRTVAVVGCGPSPVTVAQLLDKGFDAVGVEPVEESLKSAQEYLGTSTRAKRGTAEEMPFPDKSLRVVLMESVLEHVDSPSRSLAEIYRVIAPGGVLFVRTTNRLRFSPLGRNWEIRVPFYNWFPRIVKESYIFQHLHYRPTLADYSPRPAVHWFSYADLCGLGRQAGFAQFYSSTDLLNLDKGAAQPTLLKRLLDALRRNPWLRAANLTQIGGDIYMWKRR
jgi:SAM-dependent methyltransferase